MTCTKSCVYAINFKIFCFHQIKSKITSPSTDSFNPTLPQVLVGLIYFFNCLSTVVTPPVKGWECPTCTFVNIPTRPGCEMCGSDRPPDYQIPAGAPLDEKEKSRLERERIAEQLAFEVSEI